MKKISVIVPVYNEEKHLRKCIDSILNQTYSNIEIILINDGSTDGTHDICREFEKNNNNIIYISKKNEGPGESRNIGIKISSGDFIGFVDADDYIQENMYLNMIEGALKTKSDIVQCGYYRINEEILKEEKFVEIPLIINGKDNCAIEFEKKEKINNFLCTKIFKKELFNDIIIPPFYYAEDQCILVQIFSKCSKLLILPDALYYYVFNPLSLYNARFNYKQLDSIKAAKFMYDYYLSNSSDLIVFPSLKICYYILKFYAPLKISKYKDKEKKLREMAEDFKYYYSIFEKTIALEYASKKRKTMLWLSKYSLGFTSFLFYIHRVIFNKK